MIFLKMDSQMITYQIFHLSLPPIKPILGQRLYLEDPRMPKEGTGKIKEEKIRKANKGCCNEWIIHGQQRLESTGDLL